MATERPRPIDPGDQVVKWEDCPCCGGRGWFLINPFKTGGAGGAGGLNNMTRCQTCLDAHKQWENDE